MKNQEEHIKILTELATLDPGITLMGKGQYMVKTSARDIIEAGRRLEDLGIFNFNDTKNDNTITINIVGDAD